MAPLKPVKPNTEDKRIHQVLDCARKTLALLKDRANLSESLEIDLEPIIKRTFPLPLLSSVATEPFTFDSVGTELWNAATNLLRAGEDHRDPRIEHTKYKRLVVLLRVFAYYLVDAAYHSFSRRNKDCHQQVRVFKIGLKACRFCIDQDELELALKALERCAEYVTVVEEALPAIQVIKDREDEDGSCRTILKRLVSEFYLLRITHAWKSGQMALAEHFVTKISQSQLAEAGDLAEKATDLFHAAGKSLVRSGANSDAIRWCSRALATLDSSDVEHLSHDAPDLRLAVTATLVEALLWNHDTESSTRALGLVDDLVSLHGLGNRIAVGLLRFKIFIAGHDLDVSKLLKALTQVITMAVLTDKNFKVIMQAIHKTRHVDVASALSALEHLITTRLVKASKDDKHMQELFEKATVTHIMFATSQPCLPTAGSVVRVRELLDFILSHDGAFSSKATHAAQTLIWKIVGAADSTVAIEWCHVLKHPVFAGAGHINKARIGRKAMTVAMAQDDMNSAREAFFDLPAAAQNESVSRYLAFKLALLDNDQTLAYESLQIISKHADQDPTYLYACVLEAQQSNFRMIAVVALQSLLDKQPPGIHLPSVLRCTARLLVGELESQGNKNGDTVDKVVQVFEHAAANMIKLLQGTDAEWRTEVHWWSKNAYNLALKHCIDIHPEHLVRLLGVCVKFLDSCPKDGEDVYQDGAFRRKMLCHFLSATALIVLSRAAGEDLEYAMQSSLRARNDIEAFMMLTRRHGSADKSTADVHARTFELLKFDLECILRLKHFDELDKALHALLHFDKADRWETLIDLVVIIHDHVNSADPGSKMTRHIPELLQKCINESWKKDKDIVKMSRWLRLTFTIHLNDDRADFAMTILQQAASIAQRGQDGKSDTYPEDELQWLSTTAFNKAVDLLSIGQVADSDRWSNAALELARYADDNGALHANLTRRRKAAELRTKEGAS